jgi:intracellular multiplication protein IcmE
MDIDYKYYKKYIKYKNKYIILKKSLKEQNIVGGLIIPFTSKKQTLNNDILIVNSIKNKKFDKNKLSIITPSWCKQNSITLTQLFNNGITLREMLNNGFTYNDILNELAAIINRSHWDSSSISLAELKINSGYNIQQLRKWGYVLQDFTDARYNVNELKAAGFLLNDIYLTLYNSNIYTLLQLLNVGIPVPILREFGFTASDFKNINLSFYNALQLKEFGFTLQELKKAGFTVRQLHIAEFTLNDMIKAGFSINKLLEVYTIEELKPYLNTTNFSITELAELVNLVKSSRELTGYSSVNLVKSSRALTGYSSVNLEAGLSEEEKVLLNKVYNMQNATYKKKNKADILQNVLDLSVEQLKTIGISHLLLLRDLSLSLSLSLKNVSLLDFKNMGYTLRQFIEAGFTLQQLKEAGFTLQQLKEAGFTLQQLKEAGFTLQQLKEARFTLQQLKKAGFTLQQLKEAGFSIDKEQNKSS